MEDPSMSQHREIFNLNEIESIGSLCKHCGSEFIVNIEKSQFEDDECPNCGTPWTPLKEILNRFRAIQGMVRGSKLILGLRTTAAGLSLTEDGKRAKWRKHRYIRHSCDWEKSSAIAG